MMRMMGPLENDSLMATPGELVRVLAGAFGVPEATLALHDRNLRARVCARRRGRGGPRPA